jgi:nucleoid-associated protein YgaU
MPNDAKLGLLLGLGMVITVAVVFFRKDAGPLPEYPGQQAALRARLPGTVDGAGTRGAPGRQVSRTSATASGRKHTVELGDTLFSLAEHYLGNRDRFVEIYRANRQLLNGSDQLTPGQVLDIPDSAAKTDDMK